MKKQFIICIGCGFLSIEGPRGSYDICPICNWEDDIYGNTHPMLISGPNDSSLVEHQKIVIQKIPLEILKQGDYIRDADWIKNKKSSQNQSNKT